MPEQRVCCFPVEIFEDKDLVSKLRCSHCNRISRLRVTESDLSNLCESCKCCPGELVLTEDGKEKLGKAVVICRRHRYCGWRGRFAEYQSHVKLEAEESDSFSCEDKLSESSFTESEDSSFEEKNQTVTLSSNKGLNNRQFNVSNPTKPTQEPRFETNGLVQSLLGLFDQLPAEVRQNLFLNLAAKYPQMTDKDSSQAKPDLNRLLLKNSGAQAPDPQPLVSLKDEPIKPTDENKEVDSQPKVVKSIQTELVEQESYDILNKAIQQREDFSHHQLHLTAPVIFTASHYLERLKEPNKFDSVLISKISEMFKISTSTKNCGDTHLFMMKQSLKDFGGTKLLIVNSCNLHIGLCLKEPVSKIGSDDQTARIGTSIYNFNRADSYVCEWDPAKVKIKSPDHELNSNFPKLMINFDPSSRTLSFVDLNSPSKNLHELEILKDVDLAKVHLYTFPNDSFKCKKPYVLQNYPPHETPTDIELDEFYNALYIRKYGLLLTVKAKPLCCTLLDKSIFPSKTYKFKYIRYDFNSDSGIGIFNKQKLASSNYIVYFKPGYQEDCGCIAINFKGDIMSDHPADKSTEQDSNPSQSPLNIFTEKWDTVAVKYSPIKQQVTFKNWTTSKKIVHYYPIDLQKIENYFVGVFLHLGNRTFKTIN